MYRREIFHPLYLLLTLLTLKILPNYVDVPVATVFENLEAGSSIEEIIEQLWRKSNFDDAAGVTWHLLVGV